MAIHPFVPGFDSIILLVATSIIFIAGLYLLVSRWGFGKPGTFISNWIDEAFREGLMVFIQVLVLDVLLFRRVWRRSKRRWAVHMAIFWVFIILGGFTLLSIAGFILFYLDPTGFGKTFSDFLSYLTFPYFVLGYFLLAGSGIALARRFLVKKVRERTDIPDLVLVGGVFIIALTAVIAEGFSGYDTFVGPAIQNMNLAVDFMTLHIYAVFLLFVMIIPWTRFRHIITAPLTLLVRRGGD